MSESFTARLRRLRREEPPASSPAEAPRPAGGMPAWLKQRLGRPRSHAARARPTVAVELGALPPPTLGPPANLRVHETEHGPFAARETPRPVGSSHGDWRLAEALEVDPRTFALLTGDDSLADLDLSRAVFLDTETTGLSGGAGVTVYMIGLGTFAGDEFRVWQAFLREPAEEHAALAEVARRIRAADALVSFFGKSFDRHRLEDKMRIAGVEPPFAGLPHLDLYHPFRRLTQGRLPDSRLATMESVLCGLERESDLPGSLAPAAWFDFLAGRAHRLEGVFQHNLDDVLSLVTLAAYLGRAEAEVRADGRPLAGCAIARARALARSHLGAGDRRAALPWIDTAIERERAAGADPRDLVLLRAKSLRLTGESAAARADFEALAAGPEDRHTTPALIELAKLLEHDAKDFAAAHATSLRARDIAPRRHTGRELTAFQADLDRRTPRLAAKQVRQESDRAT